MQPLRVFILAHCRPLDPGLLVEGGSTGTGDGPTRVVDPARSKHGIDAVNDLVLDNIAELGDCSLGLMNDANDGVDCTRERRSGTRAQAP